MKQQDWIHDGFRRHFGFVFFSLFNFIFENLFYCSFIVKCKVTGNMERETDSLSHVSCTLARGTVGVFNVSLFSLFFCVCVCVCVVFIDSVPEATTFPLFPPHVLPFSGPTYLVPRALYLLNLPQKEKKRTSNISKTSGRISPVGDCLQVNCLCFIYQTGSVYVQAEHNMKQKNIRIER